MSARILIVEDEPVIGFVLEDILESIGARVVGVAGTVADALNIVATEPIEAAILDVNIQGELSYPVAEELTSKSIPFIFATGYGDTEHPLRFRSRPTITKPYTQRDVEVALQLALSATV